MKRIFWDYKRAFLGLPLVASMSKNIILPPAVIFGSIITVQYILTSSTYYDEYNGDASQFKRS